MNLTAVRDGIAQGLKERNSGDIAPSFRVPRQRFPLAGVAAVKLAKRSTRLRKAVEALPTHAEGHADDALVLEAPLGRPDSGSLGGGSGRAFHDLLLCSGVVLGCSDGPRVGESQ